MSQPLRRLIPQARTLITKESFRDQSFGRLDGYVEDIGRTIDAEPLVRVVQTAMKIFPPRDEKSDSWLAPRVHASLRLFRSEAADQGIWDYLSVLVLRDYVIWRMAGEDGLVNDVDRIIGSFRHQAVARLWWAAELSRNGADYRPTEEAFSSQDAVNYLTNVDAFHNRPAALAYIRFIGHTRGTTPIKQTAIETGRTLNHVLTTIVLDSFAPDSGGDMNAAARWIAQAPDMTLMDSALPQGPDEPPVLEEKIYAVEQLLERLMEEHRWPEVVDWTRRWIAVAQSRELTEPALPIFPIPAGNGSKVDVAQEDVPHDATEKGVTAPDATEKDITAPDATEKNITVPAATEKDAAAPAAVSYERFAQALRDDLGVEPSDQTRALFDNVSNEHDTSHNPGGSPFDHRGEGLAKNKETVEAMSAPGSTISPDAVSARARETLAPSEPLLADSTELGDAHAAVVETAESVYEQLSPEQQPIARRIFVQLTELGEGTLDTARRVTIEELILRPEDRASVFATLKRLSDAHVLTSDEAAVQLADAALIHEWERLREWLDEDREALRLQRHLAHAAQEWEVMLRDSSALYRGARLAQALEWAKTNADLTSTREREFLDASNQAAECEEQRLAEVETRRAEEEHRAAMQWRQRAFYFAAAMILMTIIAAAGVYVLLQP